MRIVEIVDALPVYGTGKVVKDELRSRGRRREAAGWRQQKTEQMQESVPSWVPLGPGAA